MSSLEQRLRDRVTELEALLGLGNDDVSRLLTVLDATPQQCEMVGFMLKRAVATRTGMFIALFGARPECDQPDMKLIDVQMVKVRKALEKIGIEVRTEWGSGGWNIPAADKSRLRAMMEGREPPSSSLQASANKPPEFRRGAMPATARKKGMPRTVALGGGKEAWEFSTEGEACARY